MFRKHFVTSRLKQILIWNFFQDFTVLGMALERIFFLGELLTLGSREIYGEAGKRARRAPDARPPTPEENVRTQLQWM